MASGHTSIRNITTSAGGAIVGLAHTNSGTIVDSASQVSVSTDYFNGSFAGIAEGHSGSIVRSYYSQNWNKNAYRFGLPSSAKGIKNTGAGTVTESFCLDASPVLTGSYNNATSSSLVGTSTMFLSELSVGEQVCIETAHCRQVSSITDNTNLTVLSPWGGIGVINFSRGLTMSDCGSSGTFGYSGGVFTSSLGGISSSSWDMAEDMALDLTEAWVFEGATSPPMLVDVEMSHGMGVLQGLYFQ